MIFNKCLAIEFCQCRNQKYPNTLVTFCLKQCTKYTSSTCSIPRANYFSSNVNFRLSSILKRYQKPTCDQATKKPTMFSLSLSSFPPTPLILVCSRNEEYNIDSVSLYLVSKYGLFKTLLWIIIT